jgi:hypothetical protein
MRTLAAAVLALALFTSVVEAQEVTAAFSAYRALGIDDLDGSLPASVEIRLTIPFSDRFAVEPFATVGSSSIPRAVAEGFYGAQIRQRLRALTGSRGYAFVTYGAAGYYSRYGLDPPISGQFGFGLHTRLSRRLALRPEVVLVTLHVVPIGVRFVAGMSVNLAP